jgi:hypothetical protein
MKQLGSYCTIFIKFDICVFRKYVEKFQVSLKSDTNNRFLVGDQYKFMIASNSFLLRMRNVSDRICTETQNTHVLFFSENCVFCEIMWSNIVEPDMPRMKIWRMHIACWVPKAANAHSEYAILRVSNVATVLTNSGKQENFTDCTLKY